MSAALPPWACWPPGQGPGWATSFRVTRRSVPQTPITPGVGLGDVQPIADDATDLGPWGRLRRVSGWATSSRSRTTPRTWVPWAPITPGVGLGDVQPIADDATDLGGQNPSTVDTSGRDVVDPVITQSLTETAPDETPTDAGSGTVDEVNAASQEFESGIVTEVDGRGQVIQTWTVEEPTTSAFAVDLAALQAATNTISTHRDAISQSVQYLARYFENIGAAWVSPAGQSARSLYSTFKIVTDQFVTILNDAIDRMNAAYNNYLDTESTNVSNLT